jgi:hypothetical protein
MTPAKAQSSPRKISKHEIRNSKQIQMAKVSNFQTNPIPVEVLNFLQVWGYLAAFVWDFDIRFSDFL